jgi:hypothetical protein
MEKNPIISIPQEVTVAPDIRLGEHLETVSDIENWYRCLRPDFDVRTLDTMTHLDAISSTVLKLAGEEAPDEPSSRVRRALELSTDTAELANRLILQGSDSLLAADLILELSGTNKLKPPMEDMLLDLAARVTVGVRDNPLVDTEDRLSANSKNADIKIARLRHLARHQPGTFDFSDEYIKVVRAEARWASGQCTNPNMKTGPLFETYIASLARHQLWVSEQEEHLVARSATVREDAPARRKDGGSGHDLAHDVVITSKAFRMYLQCKYGAGAEELADRYDTTKVTLLAETHDDGVMAGKHDIREAFLAIANSGKEADMDVCSRYVERYGIDRMIQKLVHSTAANIGMRAMAGTIS